MSRKWVALALSFSFVACSSASKKTDQAEQAKMPEFEQGLHALEREDYAEAAETFDHLLVQKPATEMDLVILYNSGAAYEGLGNCTKASDRYRQVSRASAGKFERVEAESLYRLSLMYECLGQDVKAITALLDAKKHGKDLPVEVQSAEIPARLAAAYARLGNREKALSFFAQASRGLKQVVSNEGRQIHLDRIAKTLFLMGQLSSAQRRAEVDPTTFLQSLSMQQPYLLQSMEMNQTNWSQKAADDLNLAYDNLWKFKIEDLNARREFYTRALQTINELRRIRIPRAEAKPDARVEGLFTALDKNETRLQGQLAAVAESNPLTSEAERREGLKREGRLVNPDGTTKKKTSVRK